MPWHNLASAAASKRFEAYWRSPAECNGHDFYFKRSWSSLFCWTCGLALTHKTLWHRGVLPDETCSRRT